MPPKEDSIEVKEIKAMIEAADIMIARLENRIARFNGEKKQHRQYWVQAKENILVTKYTLKQLLHFETNPHVGDYIERMKEMLKDEEEIFEQMTIDLYNQGVVLKRKYDLLKYAYLVIMLGFIGSVASFLVVLITQQII